MNAVTVDPARRRERTTQRAALSAAAIATLIEIVIALSDANVWPRGPLTIAAVLLGLGFVTGPVVLRLTGRSVHGAALRVAVVAAMASLVGELALGELWWSPRWPELLALGTLGLGLAVGPSLRIVRTRAVGEGARVGFTALALVAIIVAISVSDVWPRWPLVVAAVALALGSIAAVALRRLGDRSLVEMAQTAGLMIALGVMIYALAIAVYWVPIWPEVVASVLLGLGLAVGPIEWVVHTRSPRVAARFGFSSAALVAILVGLSRTDVWPRWSLSLAALALGIGWVLGPVLKRYDGRSVHEPAQMAGQGAALGILIYGLAIFPYEAERWPEVVTSLILGTGLLIEGFLSQVSDEPRERVLTARVDELSRTRRGALDVQASQLRRIERDLHDGAQVRLVALSMKLGRAEDRYRDDPETAALLREAREDAAAAIRELRELARGIAPPVLTDRGLEAAVHSLAQRSGSDVTVLGGLGRRPLPAVEVAAYFIVAESLTNAAKHASGSRVEVRLDERGGDVFLEITDFGPGGADMRGSGLTGLRQRVEALDGRLHVTSPVGVGTQVEAVLPCGS